MRGPQIIRTPGGEEMVVLPRAEYDTLVRRAHQEPRAAAPVEIRRAPPQEPRSPVVPFRKPEPVVASGGDGVPMEITSAVSRGDSRLKAIRRWRGETQVQVNFKTGLGQGYLSDLESGRRTGTPETIAKLARALDVPIAWLS